MLPLKSDQILHIIIIKNNAIALFPEPEKKSFFFTCSLKDLTKSLVDLTKVTSEMEAITWYHLHELIYMHDTRSGRDTEMNIYIYISKKVMS